MTAPTPRDAKRARPAALEARVSTAELPGLGQIWSVLALKGGELLLGTRTALYLQVHGRVALLAGHSSEAGFKDGKGDAARFFVISGLTLERDGSVLVSDKNNHCLRHVSQLGPVQLGGHLALQAACCGVNRKRCHVGRHPQPAHAKCAR